jgi:hypothetical protein
MPHTNFRKILGLKTNNSQIFWSHGYQFLNGMFLYIASRVLRRERAGRRIDRIKLVQICSINSSICALSRYFLMYTVILNHTTA